MLLRLGRPALALALLIAPAWAAAQPQALVSGMVEGYFDAPVPEASVTLVSPSGYRVPGSTDARGRFLLGPLVDGRYQLQVQAQGYLPQVVSIQVPPDTTVEVTVRLDPERRSALTGSVLDPQNLALPGSIVEATGPAGEIRTAVTDEAGRFRFAAVRPGTWTLVARIDGFVPGTLTTEVVFGQTAEATVLLALDYGVAETVVVVGSRRIDQQRSVTESAVPVDVLSADTLSRQPTADIAEVLRTLAPSFNVNTQPISDAATVVRPTNLRNLAPDHFLLLVNGKRRHRGAVIAWLGNGISDGSQGPDISVVPAIAVRQIELLRDGAAAQYGSDAIAGVVNVQLKDARQGGTLEVRSGAYRNVNAGDRATCGPMASCTAIGNRASEYSVAGNAGLPIGGAGFANLSLEYGEAGPTNRAIQRHDASRLVAAGGPAPRDTAQVWGSPHMEGDLKTFANFGATLASGLRPYGHANYARRRATGGFYYRHPHTRGGVFRGPVVDGLPTLLVGDRRWAETGVPHAGGCPRSRSSTRFPIRPRSDSSTTLRTASPCTAGSPAGSLRSSAVTCTITPSWWACSRSRPAASPGTGRYRSAVRASRSSSTTRSTRRSATTRRRPSVPGTTSRTRSTSTSTSRFRWANASTSPPAPSGGPRHSRSNPGTVPPGRSDPTPSRASAPARTASTATARTRRPAAGRGPRSRSTPTAKSPRRKPTHGRRARRCATSASTTSATRSTRSSRAAAIWAAACRHEQRSAPGSARRRPASRTPST